MHTNKNHAAPSDTAPEQKNNCQHCAELSEQIASLEEFIGRVNAELLNAEMLNMELEQVFTSCLDPMLVIREDGVIVRANKQMIKLLDREYAAIIGKPCNEILSNEECQLAATSKKNVQTDIDVITADGEKHSYIVTTSKLITLDGMAGTLVQYKDITDRKQASRALAQAHAAMEQLARIDGLTQIPNRRTFDKTLTTQWQYHFEQGKPLSVILCDIDFFKKYNDTYGHQAGDDCLVKVAAALTEALPNTNGLTARYGGEEFIFLLPDTNAKDSFAVAQIACNKVHDLRIEHMASDIDSHVTLSLGVATIIPAANNNPLELLKAADKALYKSKENGRNRVTAAI